MKTRAEIEAILRQAKSYLHDQFKVQEIGFFGSYARGEEEEGSDVDILVSFYAPIGWDIFALKEHLEVILGMKVDLATEGALRPEFKDEVLQEVVYA